MNFIGNDISLIVVLSLASLMPFLIAAGTCYIKFSIVFTLLRNSLGLQQVPSNMVLNALALMLAFYVMQPIIESGMEGLRGQEAPITSVDGLTNAMDAGLVEYKDYLYRYSDKELISFFERARRAEGEERAEAEEGEHALFVLLPAYALSELKDAFRIGFYIYLPFVVVDLVVSSVLLSLGMMMMSPVTISAPIKLILFVAMDGWALLSRGLVEQYLDVPVG